jgi:hypothetical protein
VKYSILDFEVKKVVSKKHTKMNRIKQYFLRLRLRYQKSKQTISRKTLNYEQATKIGFLFFTTNTGMSTAINRFMKGLLEEGKKVDALSYMLEHNQNPYGFKYDICTEQQINWLGAIVNPKIQEFIQTEYDYLYCIAVEKCEVIDYILKNSHAKCRIGYFDGKNADNFELMMQLQNGEDVDKLIEQMLYYTKKTLVAN